jgi:hypothetical protein
MVGWWLAIPPVVIAIVLVYFTFFRILKSLYREHFAWFIAFFIFLSPFGYVLIQAHNLLQLMWILLLTPFYGVFVLLLVSTWVAKFYCLAFAILLIFWFLFQKVKPTTVLNGNPNFEAVLAQHLQTRIHFGERGEKKVNRIVKKARALAQGLGKCWSLGLSAFLLIILTASLVSGASPINPTYSEAQQFVASDKTGSHQYIEGSYTCVNFATDFRNNALRAGYECGYVFVYFPSNQSHVLDCFNTTDRGLVFVEPQWDKFVNITVGRTYQNGNRTLAVYNNTVLWYYVDFQKSSATP